MKSAPLSLTLCLQLALIFVACGDDADAPADGSEAGSVDPGAGDPGRALVGRQYQGEGVTGRTWIDGHVVGTDAPGTLQAELERSFDDFGARIEGDVLEVRLPSANGETFTVRRDTGESAIPGAVALDLAPTSVTVVGAGGLMDIDKGSVTISDCPRAVGDLVRGALQGVLIEGVGGEPSWRMELDFQVVVTRASGELACSTGGGGGDEGEGGDVDECPNTLCEDRSFGCCPFSECLNDCEFTCNRLRCDGDPASCKHTCLLGCVDQCGITGGCLTDVQGLWDCQFDSGCFDDGAEVSEDACTRTSCCDAFTAVY